MLKHLNLKDGSFHILEECLIGSSHYDAFEAFIEEHMGIESARYFREIMDLKEEEIEDARGTHLYDRTCVDAFHRLEGLSRKLPEEISSENIVESIPKFKAIRDTIKHFRRMIDAI